MKNIAIKENSIKEQKYGLDILKFLMAILVVSIHARLFEETEWLFELVNPLKLVSVPVFFVISSFLFFKKIVDIEKEEATKETNSDKLLVHYIRRMSLFYLFWFIVMLPMTIVVRKWYIHFNIVNFLRSFFFSSTFRGSYFIMALLIGVPLIYYLRKITHPIVLLFLTFSLHLLFQYPNFSPIGGGRFLHFSFIPNLIWIVVGMILASTLSYFNYYKYKIIPVLTLSFLYIFMLNSFMEPLLRPVFVIVLFILFFNMSPEGNAVYTKMRKMSILVFVIHFFFNSGYFYLAEGKYPIMNNSVLHFITILTLSIIVSFGLLKLMNRPSFYWLKYGL